MSNCVVYSGGETLFDINPEQTPAFGPGCVEWVDIPLFPRQCSCGANVISLFVFYLINFYILIFLYGVAIHKGIKGVLPCLSR